MVDTVRQDQLPTGHVVLEQAEMKDGRVSQTVRRSNGTEYERIVDSEEAYGSEDDDAPTIYDATTTKITAAAELYLSRQPVALQNFNGAKLYSAGQMVRAFLAGEAAIIDHSDAVDNDDTTKCPICLITLVADDICATDIEMGTCHAACLEGSPVVDLESGDEIKGGKASTFRYGDDPIDQRDALPSDKIIGQIEGLFPNWRSYRDLIDCIECTLHDLRQRGRHA